MLEICLPLKPLSVNNAKSFSIRNKRFFKKKSTLQYETDFNFLMGIKDIALAIEEFKVIYDDRKHSLKLSCFFYVKEEEFFTKPKNKNDFKRISRKSQDLDNLLKINIDLLFKRMEIDDKCITQIYAEKIPTDSDPKIIFHLETVSMPLTFSR